MFDRIIFFQRDCVHYLTVLQQSCVITCGVTILSLDEVMADGVESVLVY